MEARCPGVAVNLETITGIAPRPIPYLDPDSDFWKAYPDMPARSLARFLALARRGTQMGVVPLDQLTGQPGPDVPSDAADRLSAQQRDHFEQSVAYARDHLGLGERRAARSGQA
jgi:hypothetical protein